jgi:pyridoxal phosphate enzyme (YggS family)
MTTISNNLQSVNASLQRACNSVGRDMACVRLLAVSKTVGSQAVREAFEAGQQAFGENYVQEGVAKIKALDDLPLEWHMIGPIQSNKTRLVAMHFHWAHSVDRLKVAERLSQQRPGDLPPLQVCLQVNIDHGVNKSGVAPEHAAELALKVAALPRLRLRGLMVIPDLAINKEASRAILKKAKALFDEIQQRLPDAGIRTEGEAFVAFDTLSMGMSADLEEAVQCGSTLVRVGTAIFGHRAPAFAVSCGCG